MNNLKIAVLIPAHNEERVIAETINSVLQVVDKNDLYIVDDGSIDNTARIALAFTDNVLSYTPNKGKAYAMNIAIKYFNLEDRYKYLLPMDADTRITDSFLANCLSILDTDVNREICCVVGKVIGSSRSWVTTFRLWEYEIAQTIHKAAQSIENAIIVCPGCATVYRAEIFKSLSVPMGTLTEDMDFTFQLHRAKLGRIVYTSKAVVVTQDPLTIKDFIKQVDRWYTGFWQCIIKNNIPWGGQTLDLEVAILATEGVFNGLLVLVFLFLVPKVIVTQPIILLGPFLFDLFLFLIPTMFLTAKRHNVWKIFVYLPLFYLARFVSCLIFLKSFLKVLSDYDLRMGWNKAARYEVK